MIATKDDFWNLIEKGSAAVDDFADLHFWLADNLSGQNDEDIRRFETILSELMKESYRQDIWAAAYAINGDYEDENDGDDEDENSYNHFDYFRCWLIAMGKKVFEDTIKNPDSLADLLKDEWNEEFIYEYQEFLTIPEQAYMIKHEIEEYDYDLNPLKSEIVDLGEVQGKPWDESDLPKIVPKLCKMVKLT